MNISNVRFHNTLRTLAKIEEHICNKQKGAYLRFGDGDIILTQGGHDEYQKPSPMLGVELLEAFALDGPGIMKTLPLYCKEFDGFEEGMFPGKFEMTYEWCLDFLGRASLIWRPDISDVYSTVALAFAATNHTQKCIKFLSLLRNNNCSIFVGNENVPQSIRNVLFGETCVFIPTPFQNSYDAINVIEQQCLNHINKQTDYSIVITAMGCSGRVLQKRLWNKYDNFFLFDFGSLMDNLCGWNTRAWIDLSRFDREKFIQDLEASY